METISAGGLIWSHAGGMIDGGSCIKVSVRAAPELGTGSGHLATQDLGRAAFILFYFGAGKGAKRCF